MIKRLKIFIENKRLKRFKFHLNGNTYRSSCRVHFDVSFNDVGNILSSKAPPNTLVNIKDIFEASEEEFGNVSFSILNVSGSSSRIYIHNYIPINTGNNVINSNFIVCEKENLVKSEGAVLHYISSKKDTYNLTYSIERVPGIVNKLIANAMSFDSLMNKQVKVQILQTLNKSLY